MPLVLAFTWKLVLGTQSQTAMGSGLKPLVSRPWTGELLSLGLLACDMGVMDYGVCDCLSFGMSPVAIPALPFCVILVVKDEATGPTVLA